MTLADLRNFARFRLPLDWTHGIVFEKTGEAYRAGQYLVCLYVSVDDDAPVWAQGQAGRRCFIEPTAEVIPE